MPEVIPTQSTHFRDYRVLNKLGNGTFSKVIRVQHKLSGRVLAMKKFKKRFTNTNVKEIMNLREIQALKRLNPHPNIIEMVQIILYYLLIVMSIQEF